MINLFNSNYHKQHSKKTKKVSKNNTNTSNNTTKLNNLKNLNKKSFIKKIKHSAKQGAKLKNHKPRSVESYCKAFHKVDILGNINKNLYKPNYERSGIIGSFLDLFTNNKSTYYVGNDNLDIIDILSPEDDLPIDQFGRRIQKSVYSSTEVSKVYEGETFNPAIGFNGKSD